MSPPLDEEFVRLINANINIARKVCNVYYRNTAEAEDVKQEMMYQLWRSYPSFDGKSKFSTWMYSVCLNTALTYRRKKRDEHVVSLSTQHDGIPEKTGESEDEDMTLLFNAIAKLSELNKAIVLLYLDDLSYNEIASIMGLSKSNVSVRLVRIKRDLEAQLKKQ